MGRRVEGGSDEAQACRQSEEAAAVDGSSGPREGNHKKKLEREASRAERRESGGPWGIAERPATARPARESAVRGDWGAN